jgi:alpha-ketoglutarate-dependent dioxygenase FTO
VSWHSDSSLQDVSTVAVYHQTDDDDDDSWAVALKTLDGVTPAMRTPLRSREMYYMLRDFNAHHHHAGAKVLKDRRSPRGRGRMGTSV